MQIANLNINLPQKKEEEFLKIDFTSKLSILFSKLFTQNPSPKSKFEISKFDLSSCFALQEKITELSTAWTAL